MHTSGHRNEPDRNQPSAETRHDFALIERGTTVVPQRSSRRAESASTIGNANSRDSTWSPGAGVACTCRTSCPAGYARWNTVATLLNTIVHDVESGTAQTL